MPPSDSSEYTRRLPRRWQSTVDVQSLTVKVVDGPDRGRSATVEGRSVKIGKGAECDLRLTDAAVSRSHAVVSSTPGGLVLEDLGSTNGTEINGVLIKTAVLTPGCRIVIGETTIEVTSDVRTFLAPPSSEPRLEDLVGGSPAMKAVYGLIRQIAPTEITVVIGGETGTGKEVVARTIHQLSRRKSGPFVVYDCANVNRDLLGSELFGHMKGAFTGAVGTHRGAFDRAQAGTLFLDEIGELPLELQSRLLGVLQRREVQPLGADSTHPIDVRVLAATNRDLEAMSYKGTFREDLYFRLAVITVDLPPLRDRAEDIPLLVDHFLSSVAPGRSIRPDVMAHLQSLPWPGNVRELLNVLQRAVVLAGDGEIETGHFVPARRSVSASPAAAAALADPSVSRPPSSGGETLEAAERRIITEALRRNKGNKAKTARELGIAISTLRRKLAEFGMPDADEGE